jgi:hypothetical protein
MQKAVNALTEANNASILIARKTFCRLEHLLVEGRGQSTALPPVRHRRLPEGL